MRFIFACFKLLSFVLGTFAVYWLWVIGNLFVPNKQFWRQTAFQWWSGLFRAISGMKVEVVGKQPTPPFFLVCNHVSYVDIPALRLAVPSVFVAKSEVKDWFFAGSMIRNMGNVFIDRQNRRDIPRAGEEILKKMKNHEGVIIFPEGTSTKGENVLPFNSSFFELAARQNIPVSCAAITYVTPSDGPLPSETVCWWDDKSFLYHLFVLLKLRGFTAVVTFADESVIDQDRKILAVKLREKVVEHFVPMT